MTREELAEEIAFMLTEHRADGVLADHTADAVIRLVVEACCAKADECQGGFTSIAAVLRHTFLPAKEPANG